MRINSAVFDGAWRCMEFDGQEGCSAGAVTFGQSDFWK